jgi:circadian clock protein KaiC
MAIRHRCQRSNSLHLHELLQNLNRRGAATLLTIAQHGMKGDMRQPVDVAYLADTVFMLRYFEAMRQNIWTALMRRSAHVRQRTAIEA